MLNEIQITTLLHVFSANDHMTLQENTKNSTVNNNHKWYWNILCMDHLEANNILHVVDNQHRYRAKHSAKPQLILTLNDILRVLNQTNRLCPLILRNPLFWTYQQRCELVRPLEVGTVLNQKVWSPAMVNLCSWARYIITITIASTTQTLYVSYHHEWALKSANPIQRYGLNFQIHLDLIKKFQACPFIVRGKWILH